MRSKKILVRKERYYSTKPIVFPSKVFPNLSIESIAQAKIFKDLISIECDLQIRETISGIKERRGPIEKPYNYPLLGDLGFYFELDYFSRNYFTTGVIFSHPLLNDPSLNIKLLSELLYEAFMITVPYEKQDIFFASDKHLTDVSPYIKQGARFIALYDQTYGSLRLTSEILKQRILLNIFHEAYKLAEISNIEVNDSTFSTLETLRNSLDVKGENLIFDFDQSFSIADKDDNIERVILPGSKGLNLNRGNEEFFVDEIFFSPNGLRYKGVTQSLDYLLNKATSMPLVSEVVEIPGVSQIGLYN